MTTTPDPKYAVRLDGASTNRGIKPFAETDEQNENFLYMEQFAVWLIGHHQSRASTNLRFRVTTFYTNLKTAHYGNNPANVFPTYNSYLELVDEYNAEQGYAEPLRSAPANPAPAQAQPAVAAVPPSNGESTTTSTGSPTAPPAASATDEAPASEPTRDDTQAPAWFSSFREELTPRLAQVDAHEDILQGDGTDANPGLVREVNDIKRRLGPVPVDSSGTYSFSGFTNTARTYGAGTVRSRSVGSMVGTLFGAFLVTFVLMALVIGFIGVLVGFGAIAAISHWLWLITLISAIVAFVVAVRIPPATTASAVTREERN